MNRLILAIGVLIVIVASIGGGLYGRPAYRQYKEARGIRQARAFLSAGDLANASVSARQVLQLNPKNVEACRVIAELAECSHSPAAVDWRERIAELAPTVANKLKLASCALRFQRPPFPLAAQTLADLEPLAREVAAFHILSAELALKLNGAGEAAAHFEQAARLEPNNELHRLNRAALDLQSTNLAAAAAARAALERLSTNRDLGPLALCWLVAASLRGNDLARAERLSCRLLEDPRARLNDRLQQLNILQRSHSPGFSNYLASVQAGAGTNVAALYSISDWMAGHGLADDAMKWLSGFEPKLRQTQPLPLAIANLHLAKMDWTGLETFLDSQKWAELEFLRLALLARAAFGQQHGVLSDTRWRNAARAAADRLGPLTLLASLATEWGLNREDLLWQIGRHFPREHWALRELERLYLAHGNTRGLNKVYSALAGAESSLGHCTNRNNFATTSLLLRANLPQAHQIARELYTKESQDPVIASTYAYSLHLQGRTEQGLAVFGKLKPEALATPSVALYYGVLLSSVGDMERAGRYLAFAQEARLLPEEGQLLTEAKRAH